MGATRADGDGPGDEWRGEEVRGAIAGNLGHCTGYHFIVDAIRSAAQRA